MIESANEDSELSSAEELTSPMRKTKLRLDTAAASRPQRRPQEPHTPVSSGDWANKLMSPEQTTTATVPETPESYYVKSMLRPASPDHVDSKAYRTFLNMDEDPNETSPRGDAEQLGPPLNATKAEDNSKQELGVPFKELVEKLLILPANKTDSKFVPSFLCLYRAFATPKQLLVAIIDQFVAIEKSNMVHFSKVAEMLRYLQVLAQWTATYPGDFAQGPAREKAIPFVQTIEKSKVFAPAAREISNNLDTLVPDDDADWAYTDPPKKTPSSSANSLPLLNVDGSKAGQRPLHDSDSEDDNNDSPPPSNTPSTSSSMSRPYNTSSQSASNVIQLENAKLQAEHLKKSIPHIRLSKVQWHQFMETPVEELAREIARIDWTMYSAIRPRDFVRHVSLSTEQKRRSRGVDNISAMVKHFNHLALFVSGMILLRDKPKHRAKALEKFMELAWKVRQLNNYNSLGAIVAGITGHEIARLNSTRDLVSSDCLKSFLRLTILMSLSRSHAAYRMAWENSFAERIPFLPLVRQDLTMAASANPTFIGDNVNWKKFEIMGEVIVGIQKSLENPYSFPPKTLRTEETVKLLLETKIVEESEVRDQWFPKTVDYVADNEHRIQQTHEANYMIEVYSLNLNKLERILEKSSNGYGVDDSKRSIFCKGEPFQPRQCSFLTECARNKTSPRKTNTVSTQGTNAMAAIEKRFQSVGTRAISPSTLHILSNYDFNDNPTLTNEESFPRKGPCLIWFSEGQLSGRLLVFYRRRWRNYASIEDIYIYIGVCLRGVLKHLLS